jgi:hypothetical protein
MRECQKFIDACGKAGGTLSDDYDPATNTPTAYHCTCPTC